MNYKEFLKTKQHVTGDFGFEPVYMPERAFPFQRHIITEALRKGRKAIFADTGFGKTLMQIAIAQNIVEKTNGRALIVTPLAVAFQFILEAEKMGITDIEYCKDGTFSSKIVVCNYERLHYFHPDDFEGVLLDESSILKNFKGRIKDKATAFVKSIKYRFIATATPSPNDFIELGTSAEVLGYMGYMDMLGKFFKSNQSSIDSRNRNIGSKYYLKPHATDDFFRWVNQWSTMVRMPSDLGFSDDGYVLPPLVVNDHVVKNQSLIDVNGQVQMFTPIATNMSEIRHEQKQTITQRCEKAVELASGKTSVYWCNFNAEGDLLDEMDKDAVQISGSMSLDKKESVLLDFAKGNIERLVTKAKMTSFGLNWQHCSHTVFFPTFSYEQYYQAIRRFYRFGQKEEVVVDRIISDGQKRIIQALDEKTEKADKLYTNLTKHVNSVYQDTHKEFNKQITKPSWL